MTEAEWRELGWTNLKPMMRRYMSREVALQVRNWRVDIGMTWRGVAEEWSSVIPPLEGSDGEVFKHWSGHQAFGCELCEVAAEVLGEDANVAPWN